MLYANFWFFSYISHIQGVQQKTSILNLQFLGQKWDFFNNLFFSTYQILLTFLCKKNFQKIRQSNKVIAKIWIFGCFFDVEECNSVLETTFFHAVFCWQKVFGDEQSIRSGFMSWELTFEPNSGSFFEHYNENRKLA